MAKHVLDHQRRRKSTRVVPYSAVAQRTAEEGANPAVQAIMRRSKGPYNAALRTSAFLKIDRGFTA